MKKIIIFKIIIFLLLFLFFFFSISELISKRRDAKKWDYIYSSNTEIDLLIMGSSYSYNSINPLIIDSLININSFNLGSPSQNIIQTYFNLLEVLKHKKLKVILLDVTTLMRIKSSSLSLKYINLSGMKFSKNKINSFLKDVNFNEYSNALPIFLKERFNWKRLKFFYKIGFQHGNGVYAITGKWNKMRWQNNFNDNFEYDPNYVYKYKGYVFYKNILSEESYQNKILTIDSSLYEISEINKEHLVQLIDECQKNNIKLILFKPIILGGHFSKIINLNYYINKYSLQYYNLNHYMNDLNIIYTDFSDNNNHLSIKGAKKVSTLISNLLINDFRNIAQ